MEIVVRKELEIKCRNVGREIINLAKQDTVTDSDLDTAFKPLIDMVQEKTMTAVERSLDEFRAELEDRDQSNELDDLLTSKRANILDYVHISLNGSQPLKRKDFFGVKNTPSIKVTRSPPRHSDIHDDDLLEYPEDDPYWNSYIPSINVDIPDPKLAALYNLVPRCMSTTKIVDICIKHDIDYTELCQYMEELLQANVINDYSSSTMILTARDLRKARRAERAKATKPY